MADDCAMEFCKFRTIVELQAMADGSWVVEEAFLDVLEVDPAEALFKLFFFIELLAGLFCAKDAFEVGVAEFLASAFVAAWFWDVVAFDVIPVPLCVCGIGLAAVHASNIINR